MNCVFHDISRLFDNFADAQACALAQIRSPNNFQCATTTLDQTMIEVPYDWKMTAYACLSETVSTKPVLEPRTIAISGARSRRGIYSLRSPQPENCFTQSNLDSNPACRS